ncbi:Uncharacterized conserved protein, DUF433 family [Bradyrhizobium brasilense]|uniref:Uncharacterized conserved protein, DUF433 family n=1 Tax=Bradyrhizobium brasilense TaxID=1419277 RepID=A0A1G7K663_9BRAD|nr:DUF433 domain-containing protein [Bradyrhizobium brasilense]SDF32745.1 Uncharacterized conserved protein, DUF433 family [Bradyrhizobium brasilense]
MTAAAELLKPTEAAVVARVNLRDVNRAIDEHILSDAFISLDNGRQVLASACSLISFYVDSARQLTSEERLHAIRQAEPKLLAARAEDWVTLLRKDWTVRNDFLTIDLAPFLRRTLERLDVLTAARDMVTSSPDALGGAPVIRGTRIPVYDVAAALAAGATPTRLLEAYPGLTEEQVELAAVYAEATPPRGRPRATAPLPEAVIVSDRRVPRSKKSG